MIPRVAHFVYGLREQEQPMPFLHYAAIESCRRVLAPQAIYLHHGELPHGEWWERIRAHLTLVPVERVAEVHAADYSKGLVPERYRYAHEADFIRLDALIERGGVYADIDTIFVAPFPAELFEQEFVIGRESPVRDEHSGEWRPSLCNALLMSAPGAAFARAWRERMAGALDGSWSNHSGFLAQQLSEQMPASVRVEAEQSFYAFAASRRELSALLRERHEIPPGALTVHLWQHLWWERGRREFSHAHAAWVSPSMVRSARSTTAELLRPYLPVAAAPARRRWSYISTDDVSGYGIAADRCMAALEGSGVAVEWLPYVPDDHDRFYYARGLSAAASPPPRGVDDSGAPVVVAHLVPEYFPGVRREHAEAFIVGHTAWETDRLPPHWPALMEEVDLLVVPSACNAQVIADAGVSTPVAVVPHVAPAPAPPKRRGALWASIPAETYVFYTIAQWTERKAVGLTVQAFLEAFSARDQVLLVVKTGLRDYTRQLAESGGPARSGTTARSLAQLLAGRGEAPAVRLVTGDLSETQMQALHARGDCFVSLTRGEAWGIGGFDAAAYGKPVISTGWGGQLDYLEGSPWLVDYELVPVRDGAGMGSYVPEQRWAEPDVEHGAALLAQVAGEREQAAARAAELGREISRRFRPEAIAQAFVGAVERELTRARSPAGLGSRA